MSYLSCSCFCLLDRTIQICVFCFRAVKIWLFGEYNSLTMTTGCSTWHFMAKNSLRILELELLLSTKTALAIRSSVTAWNWGTVQWPGSYRGFPNWVSLRTGLAMVDQKSWVLVLGIRCRRWFKKNRRMSAASIALEVAEVLRPQVPHYNKSVCMAVVPEGSLFWSWLTNNPANSLLKTTWPRAWITGTMSCGLMSLFHCMVRYGTVRHGSVRLSSGRFAFPLQFSTAI